MEDGLTGGAEETTTGLLRLRRLEAEGRLACPVLAIHQAANLGQGAQRRHSRAGCAAFLILADRFTV